MLAGGAFCIISLQGKLRQVESETKLVEKKIEEITPAVPVPLTAREVTSLVADDGSLDWPAIKELSAAADHQDSPESHQSQLFGSGILDQQIAGQPSQKQMAADLPRNGFTSRPHRS